MKPKLTLVNLDKKCENCSKDYYCMDCINKAVKDTNFNKVVFKGLELTNSTQTVIFQQSEEEKKWHECFWNEVAIQNEILFTKYAIESWLKLMGLRNYYKDWILTKEKIKKYVNTKQGTPSKRSN